MRKEKINLHLSLSGHEGDHSSVIHTHRCVQQELLSNHGRPQDFDEGDLLHRLDRFNAFVLKKIDIDCLDLEEFDIDQEKVDEFKALYLEKMTCPPIIFDEIGGSIIDGAHRANALSQLGILQIDAYVGELTHADPDWTISKESDDENDDYEEDPNESEEPKNNFNQETRKSQP